MSEDSFPAKTGTYYSCNDGYINRLSLKEMSEFKDNEVYRCEVIYTDHKLNVSHRSYRYPLYIGGKFGHCYGYSSLSEAVKEDIKRNWYFFKLAIKEWKSSKSSKETYLSKRGTNRLIYILKALKNYAIFKLKGL